MRCIIYSPHWLRTILLFVVKSAFYILTLAWGFRRCSFRLVGQCESLYSVERVTELAPRFFVCISEWISSTRESVGFIVYGIRMNILQNNPYRLLGVYSNSPTKERLANHNRMKAFLKVGKSVSFPLDVQQYLSSINRTEASAADAEAKLTLPKDQILHAQFWFIKTTPLDEVAFNHLFAGEIDKAEEIWQKRECASSLQNLIVCALMCGKYARAISLAETLYNNTQYVNELTSAVVGTGGNFTVSDLVFSFIDVLCDEIGADKLLSLTTNSTWKDYIKEKAVKPIICHIQDAIDIAQKSKGKGATARYEAGKVLMDGTKAFVSQLGNLLSSSEIQYQTIADKLGLEILQCGIDYYNDSEEPDAARKAMVLQRYAKSIVVGQMAKDRCKENVDILQKIIEALPPSEVLAEDCAIKEELRKYCKLPDEICYAVTLLNKTKPHLQAIKNKLGSNNKYYLKISTQIVSNALHNLIEEVNAAQKQATSETKKALREAWKTTLIMDTFDMEQDFKNNRYASNRSVLKDLYERYNVASHPYIAATVLMILSLIIGCIWQSCANYHDDAPYGIIGLAVGMVSFLYPWYERSGTGSEETLGCLSSFGCLSFVIIIPLFVHYWMYKGLKYCIKY